MPAEAEGERFLELTEHGEERELRERLERIRRARGLVHRAESPSWKQRSDQSTPRPPSSSRSAPSTAPCWDRCPPSRPSQVQSVVDDVAAVQPFWAQLPLGDRARYMRRAGQAIIDQLDELSTLLTREQGKPRAESYSMELVPTIDSLRWLADAGPGILSDERVPLPLFFRQKRARHTFEPLGVVGVIAPWNYPWSIPFGEVAVALMAGNGVVLKPASLTPLIGQRIQDVFERAGLPEGLVRTVHGGGAVGQALVESTAAKIFFTGSVGVGRGVGRACADRMKGSVLELGGKDPMIVCADANLPNAISGCLWGGFANAGQTCAGIERVYVERDGVRALRGGRGGRGRGASRGRPDGLVHRGGADGVPRAAGQGAGAGGRRRGARGHAALRRAARGGRPARRGLLRARRAHRRDARHAHHARGDLRSRGADHGGGLPRRGHRPGQRLGVRPRARPSGR